MKCCAAETFTPLLASSVGALPRIGGDRRHLATAPQKIGPPKWQVVLSHVNGSSSAGSIVGAISMPTNTVRLLGESDKDASVVEER